MPTLHPVARRDSKSNNLISFLTPLYAVSFAFSRNRLADYLVQKSNEPADLVGGPRPGAGLNSKPEFHAYHARDPHVPSQEVVSSLEAPKVRRAFLTRYPLLTAVVES